MTSTQKMMIDALAPLAAVAKAYDAGRLDCEVAGGDRPAEMIEIYQGRGGATLLNLRDAFTGRQAIQSRNALEAALAPLARIADAYDANELDDEARKFWGKDYEFENNSDPADIALIVSEGGSVLVSLAHALAARKALQAA